jgi:ATP-dependent Clp endopeptidase proteolytic subunit ClpP
VLEPSVRLEDLIAEQQSRRQELDRHGVYFVGEITDDQAERFSKALLLISMQRQGHPDAPITLYINSGGGSVGAGLAMMQMMDEVRRLYGVKINTVITGYAYSMGAIVFQAGDKRTMGAYSTMMLHSSSWILSGQDEQIFEDYAKLAEHYRRMVASLFARRTGLHTVRWWERYIYSGRDRFLSAAECLKLKLTDEVPGLNVPPPDSPTQGAAPGGTADGRS